MKHRRLAIIGLAAALLLPEDAAVSQEPPGREFDSQRIARVASLARVWTAAKFLHPYLAYRDIDWDAALVEAIPKVNAATDDAAFAIAVQGMLGRLGDPATRVLAARAGRSPAGGAGPQPSATLRDDGVLVVTIADYDGLGAAEGASARLLALVPDIAKARGVVFDLRPATVPSDEARETVSKAFAVIGGRLSKGRISAPAQRTRVHRGFVPQSGTTSGGYSSGFEDSPGERFAGRDDAAPVPTVFLVDAQSQIPPVALALQSARLAAIVAEGTVTDASVVRTCRVEVPGAVVQMRLGELVFDDGPEDVRVDKEVAARDAVHTDDRAFPTALAMLPEAGKGLPARRRPPATVTPRERPYADMAYPSLEHRVLAAVRIWGTFQYFHPYLDLAGEDWDAVLPQFIPRMESARDGDEYALAVADMVTHIHDSHVFVRSSALQKLDGVALAPLKIRSIEGSAVVTGLLDDGVAKAAGIAVGDVVLSVDGEEALARMDRIGRHIASSTPQRLAEMTAGRLLVGPEGSTAHVTLRDAVGATREVELTRRSGYLWSMKAQRTGSVYRVLDGNIGYADLDRLEVADVDAMFEAFKDTDAIVFDMRGYPHLTAWAIAPRLTERASVPAAAFRRPILRGLSPPPRTGMPPETTFESFMQRLPATTKPRYKGRTVMLIDSRTQSQAEHTGLLFEAANGTKFVGSATSGANGDVTNFYVPGGILIWFTGQAVAHADGRQLQRVGLVPDVEVRPTIAGIRAGRDEVLEKALEYLAGPSGK